MDTCKIRPIVPSVLLRRCTVNGIRLPKPAQCRLRMWLPIRRIGPDSHFHFQLQPPFGNSQGISEEVIQRDGMLEESIGI